MPIRLNFLRADLPNEWTVTFNPAPLDNRIAVKSLRRYSCPKDSVDTSGFSVVINDKDEELVPKSIAAIFFDCVARSTGAGSMVLGLAREKGINS